jgi:hypothetical protein
MGPWPWEVADLHSVVGRRVVLASSATYAYHLPSLLPAAERAAARADTLATGDKPPVYVVYLATNAEYTRWFNLKPVASEAGVAVTLGPGDVEVLIRKPDAVQIQLVGAGREMVWRRVPEREVTSTHGLPASAAYGIGYLTIRRLVQRFGVQRTLEFWQQTEDLPYAVPDQPAQAVFHASWKSVNVDLAHYIRQAVHA